MEASGVITAIVFVLLLFGGGGFWYWKKGRYMDALGGRQRRLWRDNKVLTIMVYMNVKGDNKVLTYFRERERERGREMRSCLHPLCTCVLLCVTMCVMCIVILYMCHFSYSFLLLLPFSFILLYSPFYTHPSSFFLHLFPPFRPSGVELSITVKGSRVNG